MKKTGSGKHSPKNLKIAPEVSLEATIRPQAPEEKTALPAVTDPPKDTPGIVTDIKKKAFYDYFKSLVVLAGDDTISKTINYLIGLALEGRQENKEIILKNIHAYTVPKDIDTVISLLNERINKMPHLFLEKLDSGEGHSYEKPDPSLLASYQGEERQNYQVRFFVGVLESRLKKLRNKGHYDAAREVASIIKELKTILDLE